MWKILILLTFSLHLAACQNTGTAPVSNPISLAPRDNTREYDDSTLIIFYDEQIGKQALLAAANKIGAEIIYEYTILNGISVRIPQNQTIGQTAEYFGKIQGVVSIQRNGISYYEIQNKLKQIRNR